MKRENADRIQVTAKMPRELYKQARIRALQENVSTAQLLEQAIAMYLKRSASAKA